MAFWALPLLVGMLPFSWKALFSFPGESPRLGVCPPPPAGCRSHKPQVFPVLQEARAQEILVRRRRSRGVGEKVNEIKWGLVSSDEVSEKVR